MIKRLIEACEAEEIFIEDQRATYEGTDKGTGDVIHYMEDGSYKTTMSTEEVYNSINKDYANKGLLPYWKSTILKQMKSCISR